MYNNSNYFKNVFNKKEIFNSELEKVIEKLKSCVVGFNSHAITNILEYWRDNCLKPAVHYENSINLVYEEEEIENLLFNIKKVFKDVIDFNSITHSCIMDNLRNIFLNNNTKEFLGSGYIYYNKNTIKLCKFLKQYLKPYINNNLTIIKELEGISHKFLNNPKDGISVVISSLPSELLFPSDFSCFNSCLSYSNLFCLSNQLFLNDNYTFICYFKKGNKKIWRIFIHYFSELDTFICSKGYPDNNDNYNKILRNIFIDKFLNNEKFILLENRIKVYKNEKFAQLPYLDVYEWPERQTATLVHINSKNPEELFFRYRHLPIFCYKCGEIFEDFNFIRDNDGSASTCLCGYCLGKLTNCYDCGDVIDIDDSYYVNDGYICYRCYENSYFNCEHCGEIYYNDYLKESNINNSFYCEDCFNELFFICEKCNNEYYKENAYFNEKLDKVLCINCYNELKQGGENGGNE